MKDIFVIECHQPITREEMETLRKMAEDALGVRNVMVLTGGATIKHFYAQQDKE